MPGRRGGCFGQTGAGIRGVRRTGQKGQTAWVRGWVTHLRRTHYILTCTGSQKAS